MHRIYRPHAVPTPVYVQKIPINRKGLFNSKRRANKRRKGGPRRKYRGVYKNQQINIIERQGLSVRFKNPVKQKGYHQYRPPLELRFLLSIEKSIIQTYWKYLYSRKKTKSGKKVQPKTIGILKLESEKFIKTDFGLKHSFLENITPKKTVFLNDLIETALVSDCVYVFGADALLQFFKKEYGDQIYVERNWKNKSKIVRVPVSYVSNSLIPDERRKFIWFSFLYAAESFLAIGPLIPLKFFYHFGQTSVEVEKNLKTLRTSGPFTSIFYSNNGKTSITDPNMKAPMLLVATDILRIRDAGNNFNMSHDYMLNPIFIKNEKINIFSDLTGIFLYHKQNNDYIEKRTLFIIEKENEVVSETILRS